MKDIIVPLRVSTSVAPSLVNPTKLTPHTHFNMQLVSYETTNQTRNRRRGIFDNMNSVH